MIVSKHTRDYAYKNFSHVLDSNRIDQLLDEWCVFCNNHPTCINCIFHDTEDSFECAASYIARAVSWNADSQTIDDLIGVITNELRDRFGDNFVMNHVINTIKEVGATYKERCERFAKNYKQR